MEPLFAIVVFIAGGFAGRLAVHTATRRLREAELQHAAAEAQAAARGTARAPEVERRTSLERSTTECKAALRRYDDLTRDLRATRDSAAQKDAELRLAHDELTRRKTEEATFTTRLDEMGRAHMQLRDAFQALSADA